MKYQLNTTNYHDFEITEINKLAPRSYFIPFPDRASADRVSAKEKRYASSKVRCLNGNWDFKFYAKPELMPEELDTEAVAFDQLPVPSCWQFQGYDHPFYVNTRYQFPFDPPKIPELSKVGKTFCWNGADVGLGAFWMNPKESYNFVGVYRKNIELSETEAGKRLIISFLGVCSCLDLYLNGEFIGYSEGSHNIAEFDLSGKMQAGENELLAVVHRWCTGSYLECQDMFRNNGIFRDVLLYELENADVLDIDFKTEQAQAGYDAKIKVNLTGNTAVTITLEGEGPSGPVRETRTVKPDKFINRGGKKEYILRTCFEALEVYEWNAENPVLYDLYVEIPGVSCVKVRVGFKTIIVSGNQYLLNGHKLKFKGVNHHDTSPVNGYTLTPEEIEKDLLLCREYNVNTIRTSHYPPDPLLAELADELGIYLVDEADLETHGAFTQKLPANYSRLSNDPLWIPRYRDRAARLYQRDKLHVSVVMWSLGNESGAGCCTDAEAEYIKKYSDIPIHYESAVYTEKKAYDIASRMYPPVKEVHEIGTGKHAVSQYTDRPFFLCEYAHAMGVGPGYMEGYWKEIYAYDNLIGGCVWEMVDHAVLHEDGSYTYGGDHGEWEHDGNFCVDGLFYPDRTPSTGAKIMKFVYRPIRVSYLGEDRFEIFNTTGFTPGDHYKLIFRFDKSEELIEIPSAGPMEKVIAVIPVKESRSATVVTRDRNGNEVSQEYLELLPPEVTKESELTELGALQFPLTFDFKEGRPVLTLTEEGEQLEGWNTFTTVWRAATDNDVSLDRRNCMKPYYNAHEKLESMTMRGNTMEVVTTLSAGKKVFTCTDIYENAREGILVTSRIHCELGLGTIPRFGKTFRLPETYDRVEYFGRTGESYADMKDQFPVARVSCSVEEMMEPNIRPQESGNRCDCRYVILDNGSRKVRITAVDAPFELAVKPFTDRELTEMKHREDRFTTGTYVTVQAFQQGIGTGSCGPVVDKQFTYSVNKDYSFKYLISAE